MPDDLINAFTSVEDHRFFTHNGVDWIRTGSAVFSYFFGAGDFGGSTITQQLVKNLTGDNENSIQRKVQEIFRALHLEEEMSKEDILEMYLNIVFLGNNCYGVQAAANTYFDKDVSELSLVECAALASIVQNPSKWDPKLYPENNEYRRRVILKEMLSQGLITRAEYDEAYNAELDLYSWKQNIPEEEKKDSKYTSWYTDAVISESISLLAKKYEVPKNIAQSMFFRGGYQIITALDPEIQEIIEKYYEQTPSAYFRNSEVLNHEAAFIIIDPHTGQIKGLVGGRGEKTGSRIFNRATQATRSPGSSMKPIGSYALAIDKGIINYGTVMDDTPYIASGTGGWPRNSNNRYGGLVTIEYALAHSKNTFPVKLVAQLGVNTVYNFLSDKLGISTLVDNGRRSDKNLSALAIGGMTYGVTLREITTAYGIFPAGGVFTDSYTVISILDANGNVVVNNEPERHIAISEQSAQTMVKLMESVIDYGTAYSYTKTVQKMKLSVAGKTGTTDNNFDKWFIGYSPYYVAGSWIGYDQNQNLGSTHGHITVWDAIMAEIHKTKFTSKGIKLKSFDTDYLISAKFCKDSGKLITDVCNADPRGSRVNTGYYTKETLPTEECDVHVFARVCATCGKVAGDNCPEEATVVKVLLKVDRSHLSPKMKITDSAYVYKPYDPCVCYDVPDEEDPEGGSGDDPNNPTE